MAIAKITLEKAFRMLWAWAHWYRVVNISSKYLPGRRLLQEGIECATKGLSRNSRDPALRLARYGKCIFCGKEVKTGTGDHIIPLSRGGPESPENFMPLCRKCNASKGNKDLIEWWLSKGRHIRDLNLDALVSYLRISYRMNRDRQKPAPNYLIAAIKQAEETMPKNIKEQWRRGFND